MTKIDLNTEFANFLSLRVALGIPIYQISPVLEGFIKYLNSNLNGTFSTNQILDWVCAGNYSTASQHLRLSAARVFLKHLKTIVPEIQIPSTSLIARHHRPDPFVFSDSQLKELLSLAGELDNRKSLAPLTIQTMIGLMACTGLRPGEVQRLKASNVFLDEHPARILVVRSKFQKTRWVPLHPTAVFHLRTYIKLRTPIDKSKDDFFFLSKRGKPVDRITFHRIFQELIATSKIRSRRGQSRPTPHSLRHTFAVRRLEQWYQAGTDIQRLMPNLSVYMGHVDPVASYWYLSCTPELMTAAAQRFEAYSQKEQSQ